MKDFKQFISEAPKTTLNRKVGVVMRIIFGWRGKRYMIKMFFPQIKIPSRRDIQVELNKVYPNAKVFSYEVTDHETGDPLIYTDR